MEIDINAKQGIFMHSGTPSQNVKQNCKKNMNSK